MANQKLSNSAVIVIVIVSCLAIISLGAALSRQLYPPEEEGNRYEPSRDQQMYMWSLRQRIRGNFHRESMVGKDLESACEFFQVVLLGTLFTSILTECLQIPQRNHHETDID